MQSTDFYTVSIILYLRTTREVMKFLVVYSLLIVYIACHTHEPAHLKYSREVNEEFVHGHSHEVDEHHQHSHEHEHDHHHDHSHHTSNYEEPNFTGYLSFLNNSRTRRWVFSIASTLLISAAPCLILGFIPIKEDSTESGPLLKTLLAFGSGGLLGDAFLHLIPHAGPEGGHNHSHEAHSHGPHDMSVSGYVLSGIIFFFIIEKAVRILRGDEHNHGEKKDSIKITAYLNLAADFAHNFTDGLAIGASFIAGTAVGIVTTVTVLVHEVPHEIGDFAILVKSGYTKRQAMLVQLVTALGALTGCVISLLAADSAHLAGSAASSWVLPFTAGGFIYIATVSVIPELLEHSTVVQSIREIFAILLGIFFMYLIALYE